MFDNKIPAKDLYLLCSYSRVWRAAVVSEGNTWSVGAVVAGRNTIRYVVGGGGMG